MATYTKIANGLTELGIHMMQEHLDVYAELVNKGEKSFSEALEELIEIERKNNQLRAENACVKVAGFPFIKTIDDFDFSFQRELYSASELKSSIIYLSQEDISAHKTKYPEARLPDKYQNTGPEVRNLREYEDAMDKEVNANG